MLINYEDEPILNDHRFIIDDEDEDNFHDTYDDPIVLLTEVAKEQLAKRAEIDALRKKILEVGSRKSALRISINKINEGERLQAEADKQQEETLGSGGNEPKDKTFVVKSAHERKQEDAIQKELFIENRKKALQRLREYKQKFAKKAMADSSTSTLRTTTTTTTVVKPTVKKPYLTKRIAQSKPHAKPQEKGNLVIGH